jgi:hypothetical protein
MVLMLDVPLAAIALVLSLISWKTFRMIKHLNVGKSFWIPILLTGIFFLAGNIVAILNDLGLSFAAYTVEAVAVSELIALCTLLSGIFMYSRKITKNLAEKFTLPASTTAMTAEEEKVEVSVTEYNLRRAHERASATDTECKHKFGYLQTLPRSAAIPDECLNCHKIIECKHVYLRRTEQKPAATSSESVSDMFISETDLEEETATED